MRFILRKISIIGILTALVVSVLTAMPAPVHAATPLHLRPNSTISNNWSVIPNSIAAWDTVNDPVLNTDPVSSADYLYASQPGRVVELGLQDPVYTNPYYLGQIWFYANTGVTTRLKAEALVNGSIVGSTIIPAGQGFKWQQFQVPSEVLDGYSINGLTLRFTSLDGGDTNLRAAYFQTQSGAFKFRNEFYSTSYMDALTGTTLVGVRASSTSFTQQFAASETRLGNVLIPLSNGTCLGIQNGSTASGAVLTQQSCGATSGQYYTFVQVAVGKHQIRMNHSGLCLNVRFDLYINQVACNSTSKQQLWGIFRQGR